MKLKNSKGFSLVELLIVIVLLAIVALMAIPAYANLKRETDIMARNDAARMVANAVNFELTVASGNKAAMDKIVEVINRYSLLPNASGNNQANIIKGKQSNGDDLVGGNASRALSPLLIRNEALDPRVASGNFMLVLEVVSLPRNNSKYDRVRVKEAYFTEDSKVAEKLFTNFGTITETQASQGAIGVYKSEK